MDVKSFFHAYCTKKSLNPTFDVRATGPKHRQRFLCEVRVDGLSYVGAANSTTKKEAQVNAARDFVNFLVRSGQVAPNEVPEEAGVKAEPPDDAGPMGAGNAYEQAQRPVFQPSEPAARQQPTSGGEEPSAPAAGAETGATTSTSMTVGGTSGARKRAAAPMAGSSSSSSKMPVRSRCLDELKIEQLMNDTIADSGSELDGEDDDDDAEIGTTPDTGISERSFAVAEGEEILEMREESYMDDMNAGPQSDPEEYAEMQEVRGEEYIRYLRGQLQGEHEVSGDMEGDEVSPQDVEAETVVSAPASPRAASPRAARPPTRLDADVFSWSGDFSNFTGQAETYLRSSGPQFSSQDPTEIFLRMWPRSIIEVIATETNRYAWQTICKLSEHGNISANLDRWRDTNVEEIYILFAMLIYMSICLRTSVKEYWATDVMGMPDFRKLMSRNRFFMLTRFLHFVDNEDQPPGLSSYKKKIFKITPILTHCNNIFPSLYTPRRELSLDESLLLWKGRLCFVQSIRTKAARFGIKSYDLCEGATGYLLKTLLYAGKDSSMHPAPIDGFENVTAKVVLEVMNGFLDLGHCLFMDNWYNQLLLTRYLKSRATDVVGTMNRKRAHVPDEIKSLTDRSLARGQMVARHCGDMTLISWKDVKLDTTISTYHNDRMVPGRRAGLDVSKPLLVQDYNKYMGGVDRKDQMLATYLIERKRKKKWYIKVFHRLFNTSLLNTYIINQLNPVFRRLTHRDNRKMVAQGLVDRFFCPGPVQRRTAPTTTMAPPASPGRLDKHPHHYPIPAPVQGTSKRKVQARCCRCLARGKRTDVTTVCRRCMDYLCLGDCWLEYHTLADLSR